MKVETEAEAEAETALEDDADITEKLAQLRDMGLGNDELNRELLLCYDGDFHAVLQLLTSD